MVKEYLSEKFGLPDILSTIIEGKTVSFDKFDWIATIAKVKKTLDFDIIFEFDVISHPNNVNRKEFKFGKPKTDPVNGIDQVKEFIDFLHPHANEEVVDSLAKRILKIDETFSAMVRI